MKYVAYYRVSTLSQSLSGLGLEAQKTIVNKFIQGNELIHEFVEVESGTRKGNSRRILQEAITLAKNESSVLILAKLDRLSRNMQFISALMESGVEFTACDMPFANKFTIHIFAALAEMEADLISSRTKAALQELKKTRKLGTPENLTKEARLKGLNVRKENAISNSNSIKSSALIISLRKEGKSFYQITKELNQLGFRTRRNCEFQQIQVQRLFLRSQLSLQT
jgi:DNA invertase Pin-like site-specific DNA recombinase